MPAPHIELPPAPPAVPAPNTPAQAALAPAPARQPLPLVPGWELVCEVGRGTFSRVYQARPAGSPVDRAPAYAVKILHKDSTGDPGILERFAREAHVGRKVSHPHLISVLASHVAAAPHFLVMPWLAGRTLAARLATGWKPSLPAALWIARQTAQALDALHLAGWMHADVKPANVMLSPEGHATLLDLGFARRQEETAATVDRVVLGTAEYLAPEMILSSLRGDIRSDIYSLGVMLFQLLTGCLPFQGDTVAALAQAHVRGEPCDLRRLAPQLPSEVIQLVRAMLAKEPLRRPQTPRELVTALTRLEIATFEMR